MEESGGGGLSPSSSSSTLGAVPELTSPRPSGAAAAAAAAEAPAGGTAALDVEGEQTERPPPAACAAAPGWRVVYGGSFNPMHVAHEQIARRLCALPDVRQVVVMPSGRSPGRQPDAGGVDALLPWELRYEMARLSLLPQTVGGEDAGLAAAAAAAAMGCELTVSDAERPAQDGRPNFTWETLQRLMADEVAAVASATAQEGGAEAAGAHKWALVLGGDQARYLHKWRDASAILGAVSVWVVPRPAAAAAGGIGSTAAASPRAEAEATWSKISATLPSAAVGGEAEAVVPLVWEGPVARGFHAAGGDSEQGRDVYRWLGWSDLDEGARAGGPALSSSAIRRGDLGLEAVAPGARAAWVEWRDAHPPLAAGPGSAA